MDVGVFTAVSVQREIQSISERKQGTSEVRGPAAAEGHSHISVVTAVCPNLEI